MHRRPSSLLWYVLEIMHDDSVLASWLSPDITQRRLFVWDIDSTLLDVTPRHAAIFRDLLSLSKWPDPFSSYLQRVRQTAPTGLQFYSQDWSFEPAFLRAGIDLAAEPEFHFWLKSIWSEGFFSEKYLIFDRPIAGSVKYLQSLAKLSHGICYLTGRPSSPMRAGTIKTLRQWQYPEGALFTKDKCEQNDSDYKVMEIQRLQLNNPSQQIIFIDNEPVNINAVLRTLPNIECIHFNWCHSGQAHPMSACRQVSKYPE